MSIAADHQAMEDPSVWTRAELVAEIADLRARLARQESWLRIIRCAAGEALSDADEVASLPTG